MSGDDGWYDESAGPLVRPYTITNGRTPTDDAQLDLSTQVMALRSELVPAGLGPEHVTVLHECLSPVSLAEIAAHMKLPLGVVRVLCGDLIEWGLVITRSPSDRPAEQPDLEILQAVLDGLINY
ncbi:DUF742 domain-containing protein [Pseudonocardia sp. TRM90224]|uniref:DUF742 domain-containing protein n=1 Tax=Pseudonocardia sp. TRM90224 TaxID=2812678 RepID=UPI001E3770BC|nr:DUF742 domain-containing protein [Pseudonocardia sp. TRM90224]